MLGLRQGFKKLRLASGQPCEEVASKEFRRSVWNLCLATRLRERAVCFPDRETIVEQSILGSPIHLYPRTGPRFED